MLTDSDIKKLKKIFATKEDLKAFATKKDLTKGLTEVTNEIVKEITEVIGDLVTRIDNTLKEIRSHQIVLGDHEERIKKIEDNLFTSSTP
jgi:uncharacterized phage infection (PIP) family protein YhgE